VRLSSQSKLRPITLALLDWSCGVCPAVSDCGCGAVVVTIALYALGTLVDDPMTKFSNLTSTHHWPLASS